MLRASKVNYPPTLLNWICNKLELGFLGEIQFVDVEPGSQTTTGFYRQLENWGIPDDHIHATITAGEDALTADQNDVLVITPAAYDEAASITWDKSNTHAIGLGGINVGGDYYEPNVVWYTDTTEVAELLNLTAHNCIFFGLNIQNVGANAANLAAVKLNGYGNTFLNCGIKGTMTTQQCGAAGAGSLLIHDNGMYPIFKDCQIGQDVWGTRTTDNSGVIRWTGTARPNGGDFINCRILSVSDDTACNMCYAHADTSIGRGWRFDNCYFANFDSLGGTTANLLAAFGFATSATTQQWIIQLHHCIGIGIARWTTDDNNHVMVDVANAGTSGGIAVNGTGD